MRRKLISEKFTKVASDLSKSLKFLLCEKIKLVFLLTNVSACANALGTVFSHLFSGDKFCDSFAYLHKKPFWKGDYPKTKEMNAFPLI